MEKNELLLDVLCSSIGDMEQKVRVLERKVEECTSLRNKVNSQTPLDSSEILALDFILFTQICESEIQLDDLKTRIVTLDEFIGNSLISPILDEDGD